MDADQTSSAEASLNPGILGVQNDQVSPLVLEASQEATTKNFPLLSGLLIAGGILCLMGVGIGLANTRRQKIEYNNQSETYS